VYVSDDAKTEIVMAVEDGTLVLKRRPDTTIRLRPLYDGAFSGSIGTVVFHRGREPLELSIAQPRVWDMRFTRRAGPRPVATSGAQDAARTARLSTAFPEIDRLIREFVEREHVPGAAWGLIVDGRLVHSGTAGYRELKTNTPVTPDTVFR